MNDKYHETVLVEEVVNALHIEKGKKYIDATLGNAGHTLEILGKGGQVLGIEIDPKMLTIAEKRLEKEVVDKKNYKLVQG
ncbi:MAG: Ribosomal RNA small subunit methyltransferase H, partial [Candidatus Woesebacteria bacterium GW2011_GWE1_41_24]